MESSLQKSAAEKEQQLAESRRNSSPKNREKNRYNPKKQSALQAGQEVVKEVVKSPVWTMAFVAAITCDIFDIFMIVGWPITFAVRPFLIIFLLFHGSWNWRIGRTGMLVVDAIPIWGFIPFSTLAVALAYREAHKKKED